jgi:hypothetical protein
MTASVKMPGWPPLLWCPWDGWCCPDCEHPRRDHDEGGCQICSNCGLSDDDLGADRE